MCVSLEEAVFSGTRIVVGGTLLNRRKVHYVGYQNTARSLFRPARGQPTGNAMILPFPAAAVMTEDNVIATKDCPGILKDIADAVMPRTRAPMSKSLGSRAMSFSAPIVFDTGIYTVVLARDPRDIPSALARVPAEKRPALKPEIFEAYAQWYPGWQIALCCFSNAEAIQADPLLWWYEPAMPDVYFVPTLDSHTGGVPDLNEMVALDHVIAVGTDVGKGVPVTYTDTLTDELRALLPTHAVGDQLKLSMRNGDFLIDAAESARGLFDPKRVSPGTNVRFFAAISL